MNDEWIRIAEEVKGHRLRRDEDGDVDHFALESGFHNGPICTNCDESWCEHCTSADHIEPCDGGAASREATAQYEARQVERDAKLLHAAKWSTVKWAELSEASREAWREQARAARKALSEPE